MTTQEGNNTYVCGIEGDFDDAQTGVKKIFSNVDIKNKLADKINSTDLNAVYTIVTSVEIGDYHFEKEGFPVAINEGVYFPFERFSGLWSYGISEKSILYKQSAFKLDGFEKYNFIAMPKAEAKKFLQGRKNSWGDVNRNVTLQITYKIALPSKTIICL